MANNNPSTRPNVKKIVIVAEQVILYTALVAGVGFYAGTQYANHQNAKTAAAIHDAVKAATTPATAVASVPKN